MKIRIFSCISTAVLFFASSIALASDWQPPGPVKLMIAFAAGGGADSQARLIAEDLESRKGWSFIPENVTGKGGLNLLNTMKGQPNDGTVIGIVVTESLAYNRLAASDSDLTLDDFTPITTTAGFQMGVVALADSEFSNFDNVIAAAKTGKDIRFGVMSPRLADIAYLLGKANDVDFNIVSLKGGKAVMNALNAGDIDIGWGAGIQTKAVLAGDMVNIASGLHEPLAISPDAPLLSDLGVEFSAGGHFLFVAPGGMDDEVRASYADAIAAIVDDESSKAGGLVAKAFGGANVIMGSELDAKLLAETEDSTKLLEATAE
ncbi:MAG: hypothetical protein KTR32_11020 [Granulosicoccus sp.]|nr:hypothetical protein [Granulosicoccus sp.]